MKGKVRGNEGRGATAKRKRLTVTSRDETFAFTAESIMLAGKILNFERHLLHLNTLKFTISI